MERGRAIARWLLIAAFLVAGTMHVANPAPFLKITPGWVPFPAQVILFTGLCEIAGAIGLITARFRHLAGVMLAIYTVCVFPANINHALNHIAVGERTLGWWYHGPRLAFQPVIVWWGLFAGAVIDWPFSPRRGQGSDQARGGG